MRTRRDREAVGARAAGRAGFASGRRGAFARVVATSRREAGDGARPGRADLGPDLVCTTSSASWSMMPTRKSAILAPRADSRASLAVSLVPTALASASMAR
jgi:hypothetical protein